ncbi:MAG: KH domain-containing protein [Armatimonadia bacterium]|nr:KH domain-containing protein [Armatimonadia bacterium]
MEWAEGTGKTLEQAQEDALQQLGASADEVEFEVLRDARGLRGILGSAPFRVRAVRIQASEPSETPDEEPKQDMDSDHDRSGLPHQDLAEAGRDLLQRMVDLMDLDGEIVIEECTEDEVRLNVEGDDMGLLIGRHGATLDAIQLIVAIGATRDVEEGARVIVDAENYRSRHKQVIEGRALKLAAEAADSGREIVVPNLKAYERRLMHLVLKDDPAVETYSEGEGVDRVLVISPVD